MKLKLFPLLFLLSFTQDNFFDKLIAQALAQTKKTVVYDATYCTLKYPGGDVPEGKGVCTDVVIRSYRGVGIDLQKEVHEDMQKNFSAYPKYWKLKKTDTNIDHRRVPNLMLYFKRKGAELSVSNKPEDYKPSDLVCWNLQNKKTDRGITHIGIVTNIKSDDGKRYKIVHNIGGGNKLEDMLFDYTIIGHYRFGK
ncbi:MAG TPA: DUF1287 domain-containing protein [Bacteroidia bacterium]|nr:DUF1287 domain-containing protein [Bacteroidia bacterium]